MDLRWGMKGPVGKREGLTCHNGDAAESTSTQDGPLC